MSDVSLRHIRKEYEDGTVAVEDFCLDIHDREFLILVGPSGCGKTTMLRMISGLEEISSGELYIDGVLSNGVKPKERDIALVFQNYALYPHMTVFDNIAFALKIQKVPKAEIRQRVLEAAQILDLEPYLDRKPKALSGGQKQRVAMGRAIVRNPKLFLMDEPLSNLDAKLRGQMRIELAGLHKKLGATIVYVTHDQTEAMTLGSRIVVMNKGRIQQVDTPRNLYKKPANMFVAEFIGTPRINFIPASCFSEGSDVYLQLFGTRSRVDGRMARALEDAGLVGADFIVGIRPEDVLIYDPGAAAFRFKATIRIDEMLGSESFLYLDCCGQELAVRVDGDHVYSMGEEVDLFLPHGSFHFFDTQSTNAIVLDAQG